METAIDSESILDCPNTPDSDGSIAQREPSSQRLSGSDQSATPDQPNNELTVQDTEKTHRCQLRCTYKASMPEHMRHHINSTHNLDKPKEEENAPSNTHLYTPPLRFISTCREATLYYLFVLYYIFLHIHHQPWRDYLDEGIISYRFCNGWLYVEEILYLIIHVGFCRWIAIHVVEAAPLRIIRWRQSPPGQRKHSDLILPILLVLFLANLIFKPFGFIRPKENLGSENLGD